MAKKKIQAATPPPVQPSTKRKNRLAIMLNDQEMKAFERFISTYKVKNKSKFVRQTLMTTILKKFDEDHPTLF